MPELTDEMKKAKAEGTEVAKVVEYCRQNMEICVKDNELENVAALKVAMGNLIKKIRLSGSCYPVLESASERNRNYAMCSKRTSQ